MARHNRPGSGADQRGFAYEISYAPDWLDQIRITRRLPSGRQSTKTLFRNPSRRPQGEPGPIARTRIESPDQDLAVEVSVNTKDGVRALGVDWRKQGSLQPALDRVAFTLQAFSER